MPVKAAQAPVLDQKERARLLKALGSAALVDSFVRDCLGPLHATWAGKTHLKFSAIGRDLDLDSLVKAIGDLDALSALLKGVHLLDIVWRPITYTKGDGEVESLPEMQTRIAREIQSVREMAAHVTAAIASSKQVLPLVNDAKRVLRPQPANRQPKLSVEKLVANACVRWLKSALENGAPPQALYALLEQAWSTLGLESNSHGFHPAQVEAKAQRKWKLARDAYLARLPASLQDPRQASEPIAEPISQAGKPAPSAG